MAIPVSSLSLAADHPQWPIDVINLHAYTRRVIFSNLSGVGEVASCASVIIASSDFLAHWVYISLVCYRGIHQLPLLYVLTASFHPVYILFHLIHPAHITKSHYTLRHLHRVTLRCHNLVIPRIIRCNFPDWVRNSNGAYQTIFHQTSDGETIYHRITYHTVYHRITYHMVKSSESADAIYTVS